VGFAGRNIRSSALVGDSANVISMALALEPPSTPLGEEAPTAPEAGPPDPDTGRARNLLDPDDEEAGAPDPDAASATRSRARNLSVSRIITISVSLARSLSLAQRYTLNTQHSTLNTQHSTLNTQERAGGGVGGRGRRGAA